MTKLLLVEDEASLAEPLAFLLEHEGYSVEWVADGSAAIAALRARQFDLVLLDVMLPGLSGTEVCREVRSFSQVPIIMLTAKDAEIDMVVGLELGADDYVTKPYSSRALIARIRAVLRRTAKDSTPLSPASSPDEPGDHRVEVGGIVLDTERHAVLVHGVEVPFPLKEFELLEVLMRHAGRVLTRSQLIDLVWGPEYFGDTKTLDVHVKRIRSRIEAQPGEPVLLRTVRGVGYRFERY